MIKTLFASASTFVYLGCIAVCCMGNEMPAKAYDIYCQDIGRSMRNCDDSYGNSGVRQRIGNFEYTDLNLNGQSVSCTTQYIGNTTYTDCN